MGLPMWRDVEEKNTVDGKNALKLDPTAASRSSIRRRPSIHGRRQPHPRLNHESTVGPPRRITSRPPPNGVRESRRTASSGVPPISTLLESADRHFSRLPALPPPPPPPAPEARHYYAEARNFYADARNYYPGTSTMIERGQDGRHSFTDLRERAARLRRRVSSLRTDVPTSSDTIERSRLTLATELRARMYEAQARIRASELDLRDRESAPLPDINRPASRYGSSAMRSSLPTPPLDTSDESDSLFLPDPIPRPSRGLHPLRRSWRAESPVNGLGDRDRSPTPTDAWDLMRSTITPDATLPSADSSFTSAAVSQSFNSNETAATSRAPGPASSRGSSRRDSSEGSSNTSLALSTDWDNLVCVEDDDAIVSATEFFAEGMYFHEMRTPEGRQRIDMQQQLRQRDGNRFALANELHHIDIGFRLIEDALDSDEGRERIMQLQERAPANVNLFRRTGETGGRQSAAATEPHHDSGRSDLYTETPPYPPQPEGHSDTTRTAASEAREHVNDYFSRFPADAIAGGYGRRIATSPPPRYEPRHPGLAAAETSRDSPQAHAVSAPTQETHDGSVTPDAEFLSNRRMSPGWRIPEMYLGRDQSFAWPSALDAEQEGARWHPPDAGSPPRAAGRRVRSGRVARRAVSRTGGERASRL